MIAGTTKTMTTTTKTTTTTTRKRRAETAGSRAVDPAKVWRGEYPLWTDGKHVITERLNVEPASPMRVRGIRMYEVRPPEEIPTRAAWRLPEWHEEDRVSLPAKNRIREMDRNMVGNSLALSRNTFVGRAYRPRRRAQKQDSSAAHRRGSAGPVRLHKSPNSFHAAHMEDDARGESLRDPAPPSPQRFVPAPSTLHEAVSEEAAVQKTKLEHAQKSRDSRDLMEVTRWLCASGRALQHHREVGSARLELVA